MDIRFEIDDLIVHLAVGMQSFSCGDSDEGEKIILQLKVRFYAEEGSSFPSTHFRAWPLPLRLKEWVADRTLEEI